MPASVVLTTVPDSKTAQKIAEFVIRKKAAACVSIVGGVRSVYRWKGMIERSKEVLLVIKTAPERYAELEQILRAMHPYDVPEILELPARRGLKQYLDWIGASVK